MGFFATEFLISGGFDPHSFQTNQRHPEGSTPWGLAKSLARASGAKAPFFDAVFPRPKAVASTVSSLREDRCAFCVFILQHPIQRFVHASSHRRDVLRVRPPASPGRSCNEKGPAMRILLIQASLSVCGAIRCNASGIVWRRKRKSWVFLRAAHVPRAAVRWWNRGIDSENRGSFSRSICGLSPSKKGAYVLESLLLGSSCKKLWNRARKSSDGNCASLSF